MRCVFSLLTLRKMNAVALSLYGTMFRVIDYVAIFAPLIITLCSKYQVQVNFKETAMRRVSSDV